MTYNGTRETYLGKLCKGQHDHEGTGKTLRIKGLRDCPICSSIRARTRYATEPERTAKHNASVSARNMKRYNSDPEYREYMKAHMREYQRKRRAELLAEQGPSTL